MKVKIRIHLDIPDLITNEDVIDYFGVIGDINKSDTKDEYDFKYLSNEDNVRINSILLS